MKKIYVGNLPFSTAEEDLKQMFAEYGSVDSVAIIRDRDTGKSRGFGFVEMESDDGAERAISELNGRDMDGRPLTVNEAKPRPDRPRGGGGGGYRGGGGGRGGGGYRVH